MKKIFALLMVSVAAGSLVARNVDVAIVLPEEQNEVIIHEEGNFLVNVTPKPQVGEVEVTLTENLSQEEVAISKVTLKPNAQKPVVASSEEMTVSVEIKEDEKALVTVEVTE